MRTEMGGQNCVVLTRALPPCETSGFYAPNKQTHKQLQQKQHIKVNTWYYYLSALFNIFSSDIDQLKQTYNNRRIVDKDDEHIILALHWKDPSLASLHTLLANLLKRQTSTKQSTTNETIQSVKVDYKIGNEITRSSLSELAIIGSNASEQKEAWTKYTTPHYTQSKLLLYFIIFLGFHNAQNCLGFDNLERLYDSGIFGHNNPYQTSVKPKPSVNFQWNQLWPQNFIRQLTGDPMEMMSTFMPDSFSSEQQSPVSGLNLPSLGGSTDEFNINRDSLDTHIRNILVPRVSGTPGIVKVRQYIVDNLRKNNYQVGLDEFTGSTPIGNVNFANIIADSNPNACRQLVLACHYDSKMTPEGFLGATDSAVPCAMLLRISETFIESFRNNNDSSNPKESLGLRFIFFDGEEAFYQWSSTDSLYGSRHLAEKWEKQAAPTQCGLRNELKRIELFVLLDLIGASDSSFVMYNRNLKRHYNAMQNYEKAYLAGTGLTSSQVNRNIAFKNRFVPLDYVEDDHIPFKRRGVPILSLLSNPFPKVWHTIDDNYSAIDFPRTRRILHVLEEFVSNYSKDATD